MQLFRSKRWLWLALLLAMIPVSANAGVFISVGFAPPMLPVYDQPPCPEPGLMWTPGYWAYGPDGYYWVPGAWVPAPYIGALWTPGYWGFSSGLYMWHPGYWGRHVGYYGGVNYGFGYGGIGFVGGMWRGNSFSYNRAVMHLGGGIRNSYMDRAIVERNMVARNSRVAFSGGPGGINHPPAAQERFADRDRHVGATSFQSQHENSARGDRGSYFKNNSGRPQNLAAARPLQQENRPAQGMARPESRPAFQGNRINQQAARPNVSNPQSRPAFQQQRQVQPQSRPSFQTQPQSRPQMQQQSRPQARPQAQARPQQQARPQAPRGGGERPHR